MNNIDKLDALDQQSKEFFNAITGLEKSYLEEQADKFLQDRLQKIQNLAGRKQKQINAKYDAELKALENNTQNETKQATQPQQSNVGNTQTPEIIGNQTDKTAVS